MSELTAIALVVIPALIGAVGTVVSVWIAARLRAIERAHDGRLVELEESTELHRRVISRELAGQPSRSSASSE